VTCSRDTQEIHPAAGAEVLRIFKEYQYESSILDDFNFYEKRQETNPTTKSSPKGGIYNNNNNNESPNLNNVELINNFDFNSNFKLNQNLEKNNRVIMDTNVRGDKPKFIPNMNANLNLVNNNSSYSNNNEMKRNFNSGIGNTGIGNMNDNNFPKRIIKRVNSTENILKKTKEENSEDEDN
jgi:hypothetical protein